MHTIIKVTDATGQVVIFVREFGGDHYIGNKYDVFGDSMDETAVLSQHALQDALVELFSVPGVIITMHQDERTV